MKEIKGISHLLNLKEWLPNDHINLYSDNILSKTSLYKDKLVGLPVAIDSTVLYYNHELLNKYNKTIPKTWDKLLNTSKYILKEEHKANNTNVVGYNGLFSFIPYDIDYIVVNEEIILYYMCEINHPFAFNRKSSGDKEKSNYKVSTDCFLLELPLKPRLKIVFYEKIGKDERMEGGGSWNTIIFKESDKNGVDK
ncbi:hypothetical protein H8356DRAFT_1329226 [Neocallimastix lanati (nom. inval.)]|nr:hypothetical protein H8356DRAFT_1329226 [Neocallimastix sp. JGI-2020a]